MTILFPTISSAIRDINNRGIYPDLVRKFASEGHQVFVILPIGQKEPILREVSGNVHQLGVPFTRITKAPLPERVWSMLRISSVFERAIKRHWSNINFDLILYATPPITFNRLISKLKTKHQATTFLMLKDIFPQNAVDLGMLSKKSYAYKCFLKQEHDLYELSDKIGCMSQANIKYLEANSKVDVSPKTLICPNAIELKRNPLNREEKETIREEFELPKDRTLVVYGGNLGKPQGVYFLKQVLITQAQNAKLHFVICGTGTEAKELESFITQSNFTNVSFWNGLPRKEYDRLEACADIALVFLDKCFSIPNYPSRILSYMEHGLPILFSVDSATDVGVDAMTNGYGLNTSHGDLKEFSDALEKLVQNGELRMTMGTKGRAYLEKHFTVDKAYKAIIESIDI